MADLHAAVVAEIQRRIDVAEAAILRWGSGVESATWETHDTDDRTMICAPVGRSHTTVGHLHAEPAKYAAICDPAAMLRLYRADLELMGEHSWDGGFCKGCSAGYTDAFFSECPVVRNRAEAYGVTAQDASPAAPDRPQAAQNTPGVVGESGDAPAADEGVCLDDYHEPEGRTWHCTLAIRHVGAHKAETLGGKAYRTWED